MANSSKLLAFVLSAGLLMGASVADAQFTYRSFRHAPQLYRATPTRVTPRMQPMNQGPTRTMSRTEARPAPSPAQRGRVACGITENGAYAPGTIELRQGGPIVASGDCSQALDLPVGIYDATLTLTTALDRPQRTVRVTVTADGLATARAEFETSILEVRFTADGRPAHGLAIVKKDGQVVGTLGSGVSGRVSSGTYEVVARYRTTDRSYTVPLAPGQRRAIRAAF